MKNLVYDIEVNIVELKNQQEKLKNVYYKIKEEMSDYYYKFEDLTLKKFRFTLMLMFGEYRKSFDDSVTSNYRLRKATSFDTDEYKDFYYIETPVWYKNGFGVDYKRCGFICEKKYLFNAVSNRIHDIWIKQVNKHRYYESLNDFTTQCKKQPNKLFEYIKELVGDKKITLFNYKKLGIKDVVVFIDDEKNDF